jgi:hypothetical protein
MDMTLPLPGTLRFTTAGSVDDGKSTLIGRLLLDSKGLLEDQLAAVARTTARRGDAGMDLSLFTDGLTLEREQGITIDVAYRYFATPRRRSSSPTRPGHEQYTRNMVTGAQHRRPVGDPGRRRSRHLAPDAPPRRCGRAPRDPSRRGRGSTRWTRSATTAARSKPSRRSFRDIARSLGVGHVT